MRIILLSLLFCLSITLSNAQYSVRLAVFEKAIPHDYFSGINDIHVYKDHNGFYHYYQNHFETEESAIKAQAAYIDEGFTAQIFDIRSVKNCKTVCIKSERFNIFPIFFDFDQHRLKTASVGELRKVNKLMKEQRDYVLEIQAHTDAMGPVEYNEKLAEKRADAAKDYLVDKGIDADRIRTTSFGEINPIAKNELDSGADSKQGRQFNRRVEFRFFDHQDVQVDNSEYIYVPFELLVPDARQEDSKIISAQRVDGQKK